jgi:hypothetical protein
VVFAGRGLGTVVEDDLGAVHSAVAAGVAACDFGMTVVRCVVAAERIAVPAADRLVGRVAAGEETVVGLGDLDSFAVAVGQYAGLRMQGTLAVAARLLFRAAVVAVPADVRWRLRIPPVSWRV